MFFRLKKSGERAYVQIVENKRVDGAVRQSVIATLGRADELGASGALASLLASGPSSPIRCCSSTRSTRTPMAHCRLRPSGSADRCCLAKIWERLGIADVLGDLLQDRAFWLGEEMEEKSEDALAPRCVKDVIEEKLFDKRRDLFADLSAVFMDTTSLSFYGVGGETLGEHGYSKDYRPDLKQMILALIVDGNGRPICTEMWPVRTADVTTLLPVVDRLRQRFSIGRVCVVADRGMISAATIEGLEARKLEYILASAPTPSCARSCWRMKLPFVPRDCQEFRVWPELLNIFRPLPL